MVRRADVRGLTEDVRTADPTEPNAWLKRVVPSTRRRSLPASSRLCMLSEGGPSKTIRPSWMNRTREATGSTSSGGCASRRGSSSTSPARGSMPGPRGIWFGSRPAGRLVHDEDVRVVQQAAWPSRRAACILWTACRSACAPTEDSEHWSTTVSIRRRSSAEPSSAGGAEELEQADGRHVGIQRPVLGQVSEPSRDLDPVVLHVDPGDLGKAMRGSNEAGQAAASSSSSPAPFGLEERHDLPLGNGRS